jgi:hypothetical protein
LVAGEGELRDEDDGRTVFGSGDRAKTPVSDIPGLIVRFILISSSSVRIKGRIAGRCSTESLVD